MVFAILLENGEELLLENGEELLLEFEETQDSIDRVNKTPKRDLGLELASGLG